MLDRESTWAGLLNARAALLAPVGALTARRMVWARAGGVFDPVSCWTARARAAGLSGAAPLGVMVGTRTGAAWGCAGGWTVSRLNDCGPGACGAAGDRPTLCADADEATNASATKSSSRFRMSSSFGTRKPIHAPPGPARRKTPFFGNGLRWCVTRLGCPDSFFRRPPCAPCSCRCS